MDKATAVSTHKKRRRGGKRGGKKHAMRASEDDASEFRPMKRSRDNAEKLLSKNTSDPFSNSSSFSSPAPKHGKQSPSPSSSLAKAAAEKAKKGGAAAGKIATDQKKKLLVERFLAREVVVAANQRISQHAQRKQLRQACDEFDALVKQKSANSHSWPAIVFAHVRCGDVRGACARVAQMRKHGSGLKPCVVTYTTLLKGFCGGDDGGGGGGGELAGEATGSGGEEKGGGEESGGGGGLAGAWRVLEAMRKDRVAPNLRTVNTLLRGCLLHGDVGRAVEVLADLTCAPSDIFLTGTAAAAAAGGGGTSSKSADALGVDQRHQVASGSGSKKKRDGGGGESRQQQQKQGSGAGSSSSSSIDLVDPDGSTMEYAVTLLCQSLRVKEATGLLEWWKKHRRAQQQNTVVHESGGGGDDEEEGGSLEVLVARGFAFLGLWADAARLLKSAESSVLARRQRDSVKHKQRVYSGSHGGGLPFESPSVEKDKEKEKKEDEGGKGGRRGFAAKISSEREASNAVFRAHRFEVLVQDAAALRAFIERHSPCLSSSSATATPVAAETEPSPPPDLRALFARTLLFPLGQSVAAQPEAAAAARRNTSKDLLEAALASRLSSCLGFEAFSRRWQEAASQAVQAAAAAASVPNAADSIALATSPTTTTAVAGEQQSVDEDDADASKKEKKKQKKMKKLKKQKEREEGVALPPAPAPVLSSPSSLPTPTKPPLTVSPLGADGFEVLDADGFVDFEVLFPSTGAAAAVVAAAKTPAAATMRSRRPIKMEFGAGTGEWVAAQAKADALVAGDSPGSSSGGGDWVAVELRFDRVAAMFARVAGTTQPPPRDLTATTPQVAACTSTLKNQHQHQQQQQQQQGEAAASAEGPCQGQCKNLALVHGDAFELLGRFLRPGSVSAVFVNHPEPPQQRGGDFGEGDGASEAGHMLCEAFFRGVAKALKPHKKGVFTIVTDNEWYARLLLRTASQFCSAGHEGSNQGSGGSGSGGGGGENTNAAAERPLFHCPHLLPAPKSGDASGRSGAWVLEELGAARVYVAQGNGGAMGGGGGGGGSGRGGGKGKGKGKGGKGGKGKGGRGKAGKGFQQQQQQQEQEQQEEGGVWGGDGHQTAAATLMSAAGHVAVGASSYFDRLWQKDSRTARYCLCLVAD